MLGDTEADEAADCDMLELGDALPVEEACGGYCISIFIDGAAAAAATADADAAVAAAAAVAVVVASGCLP